VEARLPAAAVHAGRLEQRLHLARVQSSTAQHRQHAAHSGLCHSSQLHWWICRAEQVLRTHGTPRSAISTDAALIVVWHESGGNPHASNGWDSNAAAGTPSEGIAQVIGPTFRAYWLPGYGNIWNPVDNMVARVPLCHLPVRLHEQHSRSRRSPQWRLVRGLLTGDQGLGLKVRSTSANTFRVTCHCGGGAVTISS
jgi:hypothetical protein